MKKTKIPKVPTYQNRETKQIITYQNILDQLNSILDKQDSYNAIKSCSNSAVISYFDSDLTDDIPSFKNLITGIKNLLEEKYGQDNAKDLYTQCIASAYEYASTYEYDAHKEVLGDIKYELSH